MGLMPNETKITCFLIIPLYVTFWLICYPSLEAEDLCSIPGLERSPGKGNGTPVQYSCLGNPMDRGAWWASVHQITKELDVT